MPACILLKASRSNLVQNVCQDLRHALHESCTKRRDHAYGFEMGERKSRPLAVVIVFLCSDEVSLRPMKSNEMRPE